MEISQITSVLLSLVFVLNILFATFVIFFERKEASNTWAWLLVLYFIPVFGLDRKSTRLNSSHWE